MADHMHACNRCSCRWDCDAKKCRNTYRADLCWWCLAAQAGAAGKPQINHDHEWASRLTTMGCTICKVYERARREYLAHA